MQHLARQSLFPIYLYIYTKKNHLGRRLINNRRGFVTESLSFTSRPSLLNNTIIRYSTMGGANFIRNSVPLPPHVYEGDEYFCRFKPRIHRNTRLADAGSWQCQVDFLESSKDARASANRNKDVSSYAVGCINPVVGNFTALCACEALDDRLGLTTYMVEYAYIHDDGGWY